MKRVLIIIYIILLVIVIKLVATFISNEIFISKYNNGRYNSDDVKSLFFLNVSEPYIAHYNYGNILYQNDDFDGAIDAYTKALEFSPPEDKEESIRINLELAKRKKEMEEKDNEENEDEEKEEKPEQEKTDKVEEQLKEIQKESHNERREDLEVSERLDRHDYTPYSGKNW